MHKLFLFNMIEIVEDHLLNGRHRQFAFQPHERDLLEVATPDFLVVGLEIEVVKRITKPSAQERLEIFRLLGFGASYREAILDEATLRVTVKHIHMILYRIGDQGLIQLDDGVTIGFVEILILAEPAPEPPGDILILGIEHMTATGMEQAAVDAFAPNESAGFGSTFIDGNVISALQNACGS